MKEFILEYWLKGLFGIISTGLLVLSRKAYKKLNESESVKMGLQALLRSEIIKSYNYYLDKGFCPLYVKESVYAMAKEYKNLGGNGIICEIVEKIHDMPTKPVVEEEEK